MSFQRSRDQLSQACVRLQVEEDLVECLGQCQPALKELHLCVGHITEAALAALQCCTALTQLELSRQLLITWETTQMHVDFCRYGALGFPLGIRIISFVLLLLPCNHFRSALAFCC